MSPTVAAGGPGVGVLGSWGPGKEGGHTKSGLGGWLGLGAGRTGALAGGRAHHTGDPLPGSWLPSPLSPGGVAPMVRGEMARAGNEAAGSWSLWRRPPGGVSAGGGRALPYRPCTPGPSGLTPPPHSPHSCHHKCGRKSSLHFPGDVFATAQRAGGSPAQGPLPYLDDDIPLLNVEEEPGESWCRPALRALVTPGPRLPGRHFGRGGVRTGGS